MLSRSASHRAPMSTSTTRCRNIQRHRLLGNTPGDAALCSIRQRNIANDCPQMFTGSNDLTHDNFTTFFALSPPRPSARVVLMALQNVADASSFRTSEFDTRDSARSPTAPGFRHFLGTPAASQRFRAFGVDPLSSPAIMPELRRLMHRLSRRMDAAIHWPSHGQDRIGGALGKPSNTFRLHLSAAVRGA